MNESSFDLIGIFREIFKKKLFLIVLTIAALVISIIFCLLQQKQYTSETIFIVKNPMLIDRNYVFRTTSYEHKDFFAIPDDVDHVKTIAKGDGIVWHVIRKFDLAKAYGMENDDKLVKKVKGNFKAIMEDTKNIELFYTDPDPKRAAAITNAAREYLEATFLDYFRTTNKDITVSLKERIAAMSDTMVRLDDSISALRAVAGNYSQLLPARGNTISMAAGTATPQSAQAMERLQETGALKDRLAADVAAYRSLINEYEVMANGKLKIFYVVQEGYVPTLPSHPKTLIIVAAATLAALFFGCILVLIAAFYKHVMQPKDRN
ncbi:Wzz/FepE/Etk N-terminal domain-containing protein [Taibaiella koreensis]|uniref:Wzz/FepE/Etk N-terminal domain-containing protein n=1 Tax=Taibaiella koreensis TaxID=1268548 RepID=UPI000E59FF28|nr:Wzz/FepE/Etk N-terminal domain-containing protein [Taibaiella koreensis]